MSIRKNALEPIIKCLHQTAAEPLGNVFHTQYVVVIPDESHDILWKIAISRQPRFQAWHHSLCKKRDSVTVNSSIPFCGRFPKYKLSLFISQFKRRLFFRFQFQIFTFKANNFVRLERKM